MSEESASSSSAVSTWEIWEVWIISAHAYLRTTYVPNPKSSRNINRGEQLEQLGRFCQFLLDQSMYMHTV